MSFVVYEVLLEYQDEGINCFSNSLKQHFPVEGGQGAGDREQRGREMCGRRERGGAKRDSQGGEKREKKGKITQYFTIEKMQRGRSQQIQGGNRD